MKLTTPVVLIQFFIYPCKNGTDQSRQGESVIGRQRRKADYRCLDPWTAETSGKWPGSRKSPHQATAKRTRRNGNKSPMWHQRSRCQSSEALPVLGVAVSPNASHRAPASPTCVFGSLANAISVVAHRRDAVKRYQCPHRHLLTA